MNTSDEKNAEHQPDYFALEKWLSTYNDLLHKIQQITIEWSAASKTISEDPMAMLFEIAKEHYGEYLSVLAQNPEKILVAQMECTGQIMKIWQQFGLALLGQDNQLNAITEHHDKRFRAQEWQNNPYFCAIKQAYFVIADFLLSLVNDVKGLDERLAQQIKFYTQQFIDALAPTNFVLTNPEILDKTIKTQGMNLLVGLNNMLDDLRDNVGRFYIKMTDTSAFEIGKNVAATPGKVVYQNKIIQLIQYSPTTEKVGSVPLLIVPPWINKFYILDLRSDNSFVKWCVDQGHTVFMISWVNPNKSHADNGFDEYLLQGPIAAMDAIEKITQQKTLNAVGFCVGGTLLGCTAAYLAKKKVNKLTSVTFLTTLLDFSIPGDLGVFIDPKQLEKIDEQLNKNGYLDGRDMRTIFNLLRANDLIWSYFVSNYLEGKSALAFDLLYWNGDSTNLAAKLHSAYLHQMYGQNLLREEDGISLDNTPLDLREIKTPAYFISAEQDHIAPWEGTYKGAILLGGKTRFVLSGSGHIAGIVNPPSKKKYGFRTNATLFSTSKEWFETSTQNEGSWWADWQEWIMPFMGEKVDKRDPAKGPLPVLEEAPGSYVKFHLE